MVLSALERANALAAPSAASDLHPARRARRIKMNNNDDDQFADRKVPLTTQQLADLRAESILYERIFCDNHITEFTCDGCKYAPVCCFTFDGYNTDGDCLASK